MNNEPFDFIDFCNDKELFMSANSVFSFSSSSSLAKPKAAKTDLDLKMPVALSVIEQKKPALGKQEGEITRLKAKVLRLKAKVARLKAEKAEAKAFEEMKTTLGSHQLMLEALQKEGVNAIYPSEGAALEKQQEAAYELERQKKLIEATTAEAKDAKAVGDLLKHIASGQQDKAEALLRSKPGLVLGKSTVIDLSGREFKGITAFQYAVWALDWRMWAMLLEHLPTDAAAMQFQELEEKGTAHGKHFSLALLVEALETYLNCFDGWSPKKCEEHWCKVVGGYQLLLPVHVVNEYCHPTRPFSPCPVFSEEERLPRTMEIDVGSWFTGEYNQGRLGETFGILRYNCSKAQSLYLCPEEEVRDDIEALRSLSKRCQLQLTALKFELTVNLIMSSPLEIFFPSVLIEVIIDYLLGDNAAVSVSEVEVQSNRNAC